MREFSNEASIFVGSQNEVSVSIMPNKKVKKNKNLRLLLNTWFLKVRMNQKTFIAKIYDPFLSVEKTNLKN